MPSTSLKSLIISAEVWLCTAMFDMASETVIFWGRARTPVCFMARMFIARIFGFELLSTTTVWLYVLNREIFLRIANDCVRNIVNLVCDSTAIYFLCD